MPENLKFYINISIRKVRVSPAIVRSSSNMILY